MARRIYAVILRNRFQEIESIAVNYRTDGVEKLREYDAVVLEPLNHTPEEIQELKRNNTIVLAYVSMMESGPHHVLWPKVTPSMYLSDANGPVRQEMYDTTLMDLTVDKWRGLVARQIGELLKVGRYDGVFMDTLGDIERPYLPKQTQVYEAACEWIAQLRSWFPDAIFVQNNGLEFLCLRTAPNLDGIVWENPPLGDKSAQAWVARIADRLHDLERSHTLKLITLFDGVEEMERRDWLLKRSFSNTHRFLSYFAPRHYIGDPDSWRKML